MGTFRIEIQGAGGHGCQRDVKDGGEVQASCGYTNCPDCITRDFVAKLVATGVSFTPSTDPNNDGYAKLTHWPGQKGVVVDDLLSRKRSGGF